MPTYYKKEWLVMTDGTYIDSRYFFNVLEDQFYNCYDFNRIDCFIVHGVPDCIDDIIDFKFIRENAKRFYVFDCECLDVDDCNCKVICNDEELPFQDKIVHVKIPLFILNKWYDDDGNLVMVKKDFCCF